MEDEQKELQALFLYSFERWPKMINTAKEKDQSPLFSGSRAELVGTKGADFEQSFVRKGERRFHYREANPACSLREIPGWWGSLTHRLDSHKGGKEDFFDNSHFWDREMKEKRRPSHLARSLHDKEISWDWVGVQHPYWRYTKWWKSSSEDPLQQLDWLGTATVTPLIKKGFLRPAADLEFILIAYRLDGSPLYQSVHSPISKGLL